MVGAAGCLGLKELRRLPARKERLEPAYWATVREIHERMPQLLGRDRELAQLTAFATGPAGYQWWVAAPWAAKTALVAEVCTTAAAVGGCGRLFSVAPPR